jgi:hypothetical protein
MPRRRIDRLAVAAKLHIERRPTTRRARLPGRHDPDRLACGNLLSNLDIQLVEAGQHRMVAAAAINDQQQPVAAEVGGKYNATGTQRHDMGCRRRAIQKAGGRPALGGFTP